MDAKAFALAVVDVLDDPERSTAMGRHGRARIENGMGWPTQAAGLCPPPSTGWWVADHLSDDAAAGMRRNHPTLYPEPRSPRGVTHMDLLTALRILARRWPVV